jgi:DNA-binding response OmpR family regulator
MARRVLVVEDEPDVREVITQVLKRAGYEVDPTADGRTAVAMARQDLPDAVVLDLMIPGLHGFEVIQHLRGDEITQDIPIIVLSAKPYPADQRKALAMGANQFLMKPFEPKRLVAAVGRELERTRVAFWGVRGSIAVPGTETVKYGGNTPCVSVEHDETLLILDAGTGIRRLGLRLQKLARGKPLDVQLLISHTHWDHIQGFPFFVPALVKGNEVSIYGPPSVEKPLEKVLRGQMDPQYFPVALGDLAASIRVTELRGDPFSIGPFQISYIYLNHPGVTLGFRIQVGDRTLVYAPDNEPYRHLLTRGAGDDEDRQRYARQRDNGLVTLFSDADLVIADAQYTPDEYKVKMGWGHSNYLDTVEVALAAKARRLALFSHDPMHDDAAVDHKLAHCKEFVQQNGGAMDVVASSEGLVLDLTEVEQPALTS